MEVVDVDWIDRYRDARGEAIQWVLDTFGIDAFTLFLIIGIFGVYRHRWTYVAYWRALEKGRASHWSQLRARPRQPGSKETLTWERLSTTEQSNARYAMVIMMVFFLVGLVGTILDWSFLN